MVSRVVLEDLRNEHLHFISFNHHDFETLSVIIHLNDNHPRCHRKSSSMDDAKKK